MTPQEFKAWFEGFTEAFDRIPTKAQWARVKERVAEIDGKPVTERVFIDRYWQYYQRPYGPLYLGPYPPSGVSYQTGASNNMASYNNMQASLNVQNQALQNLQYNASTAMYALGKADAVSMS